VAAALLSGRTEIMITDSEKIVEAYILRVTPYSFEDGTNSIIVHDIIIDIIVKPVIIRTVEIRRPIALSILGKIKGVLREDLQENQGKGAESLGRR
jgi:hypothetical protein